MGPFILLGISLLICVPIVRIIYAKDIEDIKEKKENKTYRDSLDDANFYLQCYKQDIANVSDLKTAYGISKAELIAKRLNVNLSHKTIEEAYIDSKNKAVKVARRLYDFYRTYDNPMSYEYQAAVKRNFDLEYQKPLYNTLLHLGKELYNSSDAPILEQRAKEREEKSALDKYIRYRGREKRIQMLTDAKNGLIEKRNNKRTINSNALMQKEHDWALMGGLASGIAGSGAGAVTALDYQAKNAEIRRSNAQLASSINQLNQKIQADIDYLDSDIERLSRDIEITPDKLIGGINNDVSNTLMQELEFSNEVTTVSETGAVIVKVDVKTKKPQSLFDGKVQAVIDGIIKVDFIKNSSTVGSAYLTLPPYGSSRFDSTLTGICTSTTDPNAKYSVKYSPVALWLIEQ